LYCSPNIVKSDQIEKNKMGEACGTYVRFEIFIQELVGKPEGKKTIGGPRCRWDDNIKIYTQEIGWAGMNGIVLGQDSDRWRALVNAVINFRVP